MAKPSARSSESCQFYHLAEAFTGSSEAAAIAGRAIEPTCGANQLIKSRRERSSEVTATAVAVAEERA